MNHLNYFYPYRGKKDHWEDTLTRAFFIILKHIPLAQQAFIDIIREQQGNFKREHILPSFSAENTTFNVDCQTASIQNDEGILLSVFITNNQVKYDDPVKSVERNPVYDGVVSFGENITIIIESKPSANNLWRGQLNPAKSSLDGKDIDPVGCPICLTWQGVLDRFNTLISKDLPNYAEKMLFQDFFEFIDSSDRYSALKTHRNFHVCGLNKRLLDMRCQDLLGQLGNVKSHRGWKSYLECRGICRMFALEASPEKEPTEIVLELYPGNNIGAARPLYERLDLNRLLSCLSQGWKIGPHFHLSDSFKQFFWANSAISLVDFIKYWKSNIAKIRQYTRDDFEVLRRELLQTGMINNSDYEDLDNSLINSGRNIARVIPGLSIHYSWPLDEAIKMDSSSKFEAKVKDRIQEILQCWQQSIDDIVQATPAGILEGEENGGSG